MSPFPIALMAIYSHFDSTYYFLEYMLSHPVNRSVQEIILGVVIRVTILLPICSEMARTGAFYTVCLAVSVSRFVKFTKNLQAHDIKVTQFYKFYSLGRLVLKIQQRLMDSVVYLGLFACFWVTVICVCVAVKGDEHIPTFIHWYFTAAAPVVITFQVLFYPDAAKACDNNIKLVRRYKQMAMQNYSNLKTKGRKIDLLVAISIYPIRIPYGPFYVLGSEFFSGYFSLLLQRTADAILILDF